MLVGGINLIRLKAASRYPMPQGMGNIGFCKEYESPVTLMGGGKEFNLPCDPLIAVGRSNEIVKRSVAKPNGQGSIKESWAVDDWAVTISGIIVAKTKDELNADLKALSEICALRESLAVTCPPLNDHYGINNLAIERLDFPFTPGELNQQFSITAVSDESHELLEEL